jgi:hypothetical protein
MIGMKITTLPGKNIKNGKLASKKPKMINTA